jgi:hypothetical protein
VRALLLLALLLAAGCGGGDDDGRGEIPDIPVDAVDETERVMLSPAESAAAVRAVEMHSNRMRDSVRAAAGLPDEEAPPPPAPSRPSPRGYADCMAQAAETESADEREVLEGICRRLPGAP